MANYTMQLRRVCDIFTRQEVENWFKSYNLNDFLTPEQIAQITKYNVWSKEKLATKIVDHYYMREIGFETPALFSHYAKITMNEIMEKYLLIIYTKFLEYDPLSSVDYTEEYTRTIDVDSSSSGTTNGQSNSSSQNNASGLNVTSNTPQGQIQKQQVLQGKYASQVNASETESNITDETTTSSSANNNGTSNTLEKYTHTMKGDNGVIVTNQYLIREFRELATNIDLEIINELNSLFMGIY